MRGKQVLFSDFTEDRIVLAFRPVDGAFEVTNPAIEKDSTWLSDVSALWTGESWEVINAFIARLRAANADAVEGDNESLLRNALGRLSGLEDFPFLAVEIGREVDEEQVAEIFLRVNSGGTTLTQADFILTLLSVFREEDRRRLEGFAQAAMVMPVDGQASPYNHLISPSADQMLRAAVLVGFSRGRLQSVLALLRGASVDGDEPLTEADRDAQLDTLTIAITRSLDLTSWHEYIKTLMSAGFRRSTEVSSPNTAVLVYALYLIGRGYGLPHSDLRTTIARYFFMSTLTGRYTRGAFETQITQDVQAFTAAASGAEYLARLKQTIDTALTSDFWTISLPEMLATSAGRSPGLFAYAAALCLVNARVPPFVAQGDGEQKAALFIRDLFDPIVSPKKAPIERHHLFPRAYLATKGITGVQKVNQIANLGYVEWPENVEISDKAPAHYWPRYSGQFTPRDLADHALPSDWHLMSYEAFLAERRKLIAAVVQRGFESIGAIPADAQEASSPPLVPAAIKDTYLHAKQPFTNETAIRRIVRQLSGTVLWYEQHLDRTALEILAEELPVDQIDELRLMSGPANLTSKTKKAFVRFTEELEAKGTACEWKVLDAVKARSIHARIISDDNQTYEIPPLSFVLAGGVDSIRTSDIPMGTFTDAWESDGTALAEFETTS